MDSYLQGRFTDRVYNHRVPIKAHYERWRGGRVVDGSGLENQHVRKGIVGSNPTLSVLTPVTGRFLMLQEVSGSLQCNWSEGSSRLKIIRRSSADHAHPVADFVAYILTLGFICNKSVSNKSVYNKSVWNIAPETSHRGTVVDVSWTRFHRLAFN